MYVDTNQLSLENKRFEELRSIWNEMEKAQQQQQPYSTQYDKKFAFHFGSTSNIKEDEPLTPLSPKARQSVSTTEFTSSEIINLRGGKKPKIMHKLGDIVQKNQKAAQANVMNAYMSMGSSHSPKNTQKLRKQANEIRSMPVLKSESKIELKEHPKSEVDFAETRLSRNKLVAFKEDDLTSREVEFKGNELPEKLDQATARDLLELSPLRQLHEKIVFHSSKYNNSIVPSHEQQLYKLQRWRGSNWLTEQEAKDLERKFLIRHKVRLYQLKLVREPFKLLVILNLLDVKHRSQTFKRKSFKAER